jgi:hypothetical protein
MHFIFELANFNVQELQLKMIESTDIENFRRPDWKER